MSHKNITAKKSLNAKSSPNKPSDNIPVKAKKSRRKQPLNAQNSPHKPSDNKTVKAKKPRRKKINRHPTDYAENKTASLRIQDYYIPPAPGIAAKLFSATKDFVIGKKAPKDPHAKIDTEQDSKEINEKLQALETLISKLNAEIKELDKQALALKTPDNEPDPVLSAKRNKIIEQIDDLLVKKIELIPALIREHATKRVDVFFYLLIAVYKTNVIVTKGDTIGQHGKGSELTRTEGCHLSLIPNSVFRMKEVTKKNGVQSAASSFFYRSAAAATTAISAAVTLAATHAPALTGALSRAPAPAPANTAAAASSGVNTQAPTGTKAPASANTKASANVKTAASTDAAAPVPAQPKNIATLLSETYFIKDVLNMTTELPGIVNDFDGQMEGKWNRSLYVKKCIAIVNRVSRGMINPVEGLSEFCKQMTLFFSDMDKKYVSLEPYYSTPDEDICPKGAKTLPYPKAIAAAWKYEREGTFRYLDPVTMKPDWNYVNMMLRHRDLWYIENRFLAMQNEILFPPIEAKKKTNDESKPSPKKP